MIESVFNWRVDQIEQNFAGNDTISIDQNLHTIHLPGGNSYIPSRTACDYHGDNSFVRMMMGAIRSGKSVMSCSEICLRTSAMKPCKDGVRRVVCPVIRNTYPELKTTTVRTWESWWGGLGKLRTNFGSPISFIHEYNDGFGDIELLVWFLALDKPKDVSKLLSLEATFAYVNEARELPAAIFEHLRGRVGQYPPRNMMDEENRDYWYGVFADTNPPDTDSWIYKTFEIDRPSGFRLFKQPPALIEDEKGATKDNTWGLKENPLAENVKNLPTNYYMNLLPGSTEEYRKVYIFGKYGTTQSGKLVYGNYNDDVHTREDIEFEKGALYLGWDGGLTPASLLCELVGNELRCIKEWVTERMYFDELVTLVKPYLVTNLKGRTITSVCDPSFSDDYLKLLKKEGIPTTKCDTNDIAPRISSVNYFLTRSNKGIQSLQVSKSGCPTLRKGFNSKYCYKRIQIIGEEKYRDIPDKTHPYSDIQDCLQYICRKITARLEKHTQKKSSSRIKMFNNEWT